MGKQAPPAVPDPTKTAAAQTASNLATAQEQAKLNNTSQVTPYGNLTYTKNADGSYVATQTLSPAEQQLLNTNQGTQQSLANTAQTEAGKLPGLLDTPVDLSGANLDKYTNTHFLDTFNQQQDRGLEQLTSQLANQGIQIGSDAYTNAIGDYNRSRSSSLNDMLGSAQDRAQSAILAQRNQPLNEIIGLSSGSQVQQPNLTSTPQTGVAGTDIAGITQNAYNSQMANYQYQQQQNQALMGGLFGLGSAAIYHSDERLKEDIEKVGELPDETGVFTYRYKPGHDLPKGQQIGVMAQEVEKTNPGAVSRDSEGFRMVDYKKVLAKAVLASAQKKAA